MKTITLKNFGIGRYDSAEPFPVGDLSLELKNFPKIHGEYRYIAYMNGEKIVQRAVSEDDNAIEIEQSLLGAGTLKSVVELYVNGEKVKTLKIEDLTLKDDGGELTADPEIAAIITRETALENELKDDEEQIKEDIQKLTEELSTAEDTEKTDAETLRAIAVALLKFAYTAYNAIPYLNGGDLKTFANEIGLDLSVLTAEEQNKITGDITNEN